MAEPENPFEKYVTPSAVAPVPVGPEVNPFAKYVTPDVSVLESFLRGGAEGATFGFDDKLGLDKERREASRKANPWTHFMGEMAGTVLPMAVATPLAAVRGAGIAARVARGVATPLVPGEMATLGQSIGQGAKLGVTYGALSGAGHADVKEDDSLVQAGLKRAGGALVGGAQGAVLGPAIGAVGYPILRAAQGLGGARSAARAETENTSSGALTAAARGFERDRITPDQLIANIRAEFPDDTAAAGGAGVRFWGSASAPAASRGVWTADMVDDVVRRSMAGESAGDISTALSASGRGPGPVAVQTMLDELAARHLGPLNIVDRAGLVRTGSGDNTQMTLRAAAGSPGEARSIAREGLLERQVGSGGRIGQLFERLLGSSDYEGVAASHSGRLQAAGEKAYADAIASEAPFSITPILERWNKSVAGRRGPVPEGLSKAIDSLHMEVPIRAMDTGAIVGKNLVAPRNLQEFIDARQNLTAAIETAIGQNNRQLAARLTQLRNELSDEVRRTNPKWGSANDIWRDGRAAEEALEAGARMSTRLSAGTRENLAVFTQAERAARTATTDAQREAAESAMTLFRVGLVRALNDMLANKPDTANLTRELLLPGARQTLERVLGKSDAQQFFRVLRAEQQMNRTYSSQFGSQTTPLREAIDDLNWAPRFEGSWRNLGLGWAMRHASEWVARNINNARNEQLMRLYTETNPLAQIDTLRAVSGVQNARTAAGQRYGAPVIASAGPAANALLGVEHGNLVGAQPPPFARERR